jgi:glutaredoxin
VGGDAARALDSDVRGLCDCEAGCKHCRAAKFLLESYGVVYEDIDVSRYPERQSEVYRLTGERVVPQVCVHVRVRGRPAARNCVCVCGRTVPAPCCGLPQRECCGDALVASGCRALFAASQSCVSVCRPAALRNSRVCRCDVDHRRLRGPPRCLWLQIFLNATLIVGGNAQLQQLHADGRLADMLVETLSVRQPEEGVPLSTAEYLQLRSKLVAPPPAGACRRARAATCRRLCRASGVWRRTHARSQARSHVTNTHTAHARAATRVCGSCAFRASLTGAPLLFSCAHSCSAAGGGVCVRQLRRCVRGRGRWSAGLR